MSASSLHALQSYVNRIEDYTNATTPSVNVNAINTLDKNNFHFNNDHDDP